MQWNNTTKSIEIGSHIVEWDIKSAGINLCKFYDILSSSKIAKIENLPKEKRNVAIGKLCEKNKVFAEELETAFNTIIDTFIFFNHLDKEQDIISINRDAIFVINRDINVPTFGNVEFIKKNEFIHYLALPEFKFFVKKDGSVVPKGLQKYADIHKDGILHLIYDVCNTMHTSNMDPEVISRYLSDMVNMYKNRQLDCEYYREFNSLSGFKVNDDEGQILLTEISEDDLVDVDISYNYTHIIIPLIRMMY